MKYIMITACLMLSACAEKRVSLREVQDYDTAVRIAESRGLQTPEMYAHLGQLMNAYVKHPAPDPMVKAMQDAADAQQMQAVNGFIAVTPSLQQQPYQPPMSPGEFRRAMAR